MSPKEVDSYVSGYNRGYKLSKANQDGIIKLILKTPFHTPQYKEGIEDGDFRWKYEQSVLEDLSYEIHLEIEELKRSNTIEKTKKDMNKQEETEYIKMFNDGYNLMKSGQQKLLDMLTGMTTPKTTFHEALKDAKAEWEFEQQLAHEMEEEYSRKKKELKRAMDQNRNQNNIER
jgi:hypothetical protein